MNKGIQKAEVHPRVPAQTFRARPVELLHAGQGAGGGNEFRLFSYTNAIWLFWQFPSYYGPILNTSTAHWIINPFRRTSEHNHKLFHFETRVGGLGQPLTSLFSQGNRILRLVKSNQTRIVITISRLICLN